jgi:hypothetical protein
MVSPYRTLARPSGPPSYLSPGPALFVAASTVVVFFACVMHLLREPAAGRGLEAAILVLALVVLVRCTVEARN